MHFLEEFALLIALVYTTLKCVEIVDKLLTKKIVCDNDSESNKSSDLKKS